VVPVYNIPEVSAELKFTGPVLCGHLPRQDHEVERCAIRATNPGVNLPNADITVVHRSDGSGTSYIWCDYLSKVSAEYRKTVGVATSVNWPAGVGAKGNERGGTGQADARLDRIRRADLRVAEKIAYGAVQNLAGEWVRASTETVSTLPRCREEHAEGFPRLDHECARPQCLPDLVVHVAPPPGSAERRRPFAHDGRLHALGSHRRPAVRGATRYAPLPKEVVALELKR